MKQQTGFTLIEVMITVAIVAILAAIAYPSYLSHVQSVRREEAKRTLVEAAQHMESYYSMNFKYSGSLSGSIPTGYNVRSEFSDFYSLRATVGDNSYTLTATPTGSQASDSCSTLTVTHTGAKTPATGGCW